MNDTLSKVIIFTAGATIGSVVTWKLLRTKYEQIAQEEIDSVKEMFARKEENDDPIGEGVSKDEIKTVKTILEEAGYANTTIIGGKEDLESMQKPYVISPDEFDEIEEYDTDSLTYYTDGVLADNDGNIIDDVDNIVGSDSLDCFGKYEEDSVFVRNDRLKCDYEILMDYRPYSDVFTTLNPTDKD